MLSYNYLQAILYWEVKYHLTIVDLFDNSINQIKTSYCSVHNMSSTCSKVCTTIDAFLHFFEFLNCASGKVLLNFLYRDQRDANSQVTIIFIFWQWWRVEQVKCQKLKLSMI